jgi:hypothetical protein
LTCVGLRRLLPSGDSETSKTSSRNATSPSRTKELRLAAQQESPTARPDAEFHLDALTFIYVSDHGPLAGNDLAALRGRRGRDIYRFLAGPREDDFGGRVDHECPVFARSIVSTPLRPPSRRAGELH